MITRSNGRFTASATGWVTAPAQDPAPDLARVQLVRRR